DYKSYEGRKTLEELEDQFRKNVSEKNDYGFKYAPADKAKFMDALAVIEGSDADIETLKKDIVPLLSVRPATGAVFNLARALSPADAENVENISGYWGVDALPFKELSDYIGKAYMPDDAKNDKGETVVAPAKAKVILGEMMKAAGRYKIKNLSAIDELTEYISRAEESERTYNGTVFASVEEMNKAQENEKKLIEECDDLSALSMDELKKLRRYIYDMKLDRKTASKYLIKVRVAMNDAEENSIKQLTFGMQNKSRTELAALKKKIAEECDETIAAPYIKKIESADLSAQLKELSGAFSTIPDAHKADELEKKLAEGGYDKMFCRHYTAKINDARDGFARKELESACAGIDTADKAKLSDIEKKLEGVKCRDALKAAYSKKIAARKLAIEEDEAAKIFGAIASADKAKIEELRKVISEGKFRKSITDKYVPKLDARVVEIENAEFIKKCETIPTMDKKALDEIVGILKSGKYPTEINEKYLPLTKEREKALLKAEIDELAKDVKTMSFEKLDELEKKLVDDRFPEELTKSAFAAAADRRAELYRKEVDDLCKSIDTLDKKGVEELRGKLGNDKYDAEYVKKYTEKLDKRIDKIETDKVNELTKDIDKLKKEELEKLTAQIKELGFKEENTKAAFEKIHSKEISLMKAELESLCKNIDKTPRNELAKLKEALADGAFDKELSTKYIEQIDKRSAELIKTELSELCRNISGSPKDKLLEMKKKIAEVPEYAEPGKPYVDQIDNRLKKLDKEEFDKQMKEIDSLDREQLDKFIDSLEKRRPTLDPKNYEEVYKKCEEREEYLAKKELDEIVAGCDKADLEKLLEIKNKIQGAVHDGSYSIGQAQDYINKLNDVMQLRYVEYYSKLTQNIGAMSRVDLIVLREKIEKNEVKAPDDTLQRQITKVNAKIREADRLALDKKCKNLRSFSEYQCDELIKDINEMDIGDDDKKEYINKCKLQITNTKNAERDEYVRKLSEWLLADGARDSVFYLNNEKGATIFANYYEACTSKTGGFASVGEFEPAILIYESNAGHTEEAYMLTLDNFFYNAKGGMGQVAVDKIERFEGKSGLLKQTFELVDKEGKKHELPVNKAVIPGKMIEAVASALNKLLKKMQDDKTEVNIRRAEEIKKIAEEKQRELENERLSIEAARRKAEEEERKAKEKKEEPKPEIKPEEKKAEEKKPEDKKDEKPVVKKEFKPIQVVVAPIPEVKPLSKPEEKKPEAKPEEKKPEAKPEEKKPEAKPEEKKPEAKPEEKKPEAKPEEKKPEAKPEEKKPEGGLKLKFCDQCGAKIPNENAKFCMECGNRLIK
ncbi:MAG: hypothetical protein II695_12505, partial [Oscillospiraceae bacterium]|nr:hypothetical protein [Oscillospiraceae bacterium]